MKVYLSVREISYKWNVSERWVSKLAQDGRIPGVERFGRSWAAEKPADPRKAKEKKTMTYEEAVQAIQPGRYRHFKASENSLSRDKQRESRRRRAEELGLDRRHGKTRRVCGYCGKQEERSRQRA